MKSGLKNFYFTGIATFCFLLLFICGMSAKAAYIEGPEPDEEGYPIIVCDDGFEYQIKANEAVVRGYRGNNSEITVPATVTCAVDNRDEAIYSVRAIGKRAFSINNSRKCISIPKNRKGEFPNVGDVYAGKSGGTLLTKVNLTSPELDTIGEGAFSDNTNIVTVVISPTVGIIGSSCFKGCSKLRFINIPDKVTTIPNSCFEKCTSLTSLPLHIGITTIGGSAFEECKSLTVISLHDGITSIGSGAFEGCVNAVSIKIPTGISEIPSKMCRNCICLQGVAIPKNIKSIGNEAFAYCRDFGSVSLEEGLEKIGAEAFYDTPTLTSISIPYSVTSISSRAIGYYLSEAGPRLVPEFTIYGFKDTAANKYADSNGLRFEGTYKLGAVVTAKKAEYVTLDNSEVLLTKIKDLSVTSFEVPKTITVNGITYKVTGIADKAFYESKKLKKVTILENVKTIGNSAFEGCSALTEVTIGKNVTSIGKKAFYKCKKLQTVTINSKKIKTFGKKCFKSIAKKANIKVPKAKISNYKKKIKKSGIAKSVSVVKK